MNKTTWIIVAVVIVIVVIGFVVIRGEGNDTANTAVDATSLNDNDVGDSARNPNDNTSLPIVGKEKDREDNCDLLVDSSFKSVSKHEVGLGPDGVAMGYWTITFGKVGLAGESEESGVAWHHSDVVESGTYTCEDNTIQVMFFDYSITAKYDADEEILSWEGVEYRKTK